MQILRGKGYLALLTVGLGLLLSPADLVGQPALAERQTLPTLTTAHDVHSLTIEQATRNYPVHLTAVVTYYDPYVDPRRPALFVSDASGGILCLYACASLPGGRPG